MRSASNTLELTTHGQPLRLHPATMPARLLLNVLLLLAILSAHVLLRLLDLSARAACFVCVTVVSEWQQSSQSRALYRRYPAHKMITFTSYEKVGLVVSPHSVPASLESPPAWQPHGGAASTSCQLLAFARAPQRMAEHSRSTWMYGDGIHVQPNPVNCYT
jgi:hypothetical protein